jgi:hypothetical protein
MYCTRTISRSLHPTYTVGIYTGHWHTKETLIRPLRLRGNTRQRGKITGFGGFSGTLIGWKSGKTNHSYVPLWDRIEGAWLWTLRGDSITDGWLKPDFVKKILVRPMNSSATSTSSLSGSCMGRYPKQFKTTFYPP